MDIGQSVIAKEENRRADVTMTFLLFFLPFYFGNFHPEKRPRVCLFPFRSLSSSQSLRMTTATLESESNNGAMPDEQSTFDSEQISSDEQLTEIIDSINLAEESTSDEATPSPAPRTAGQTAIGAKLVKKLETFGRRQLVSFDILSLSECVCLCFSCEFQRNQSSSNSSVSEQ